MFVSVFGSRIFVRPKHESNALEPTVVTPAGTV